MSILLSTATTIGLAVMGLAVVFTATALAIVAIHVVAAVLVTWTIWRRLHTRTRIRVWRCLSLAFWYGNRDWYVTVDCRDHIECVHWPTGRTTILWRG